MRSTHSHCLTQRIARPALALALLFTPALTACGAGPQVAVVSQATPNPLVGVKTYGFAGVSFDGFTFEGAPEQQWLATRNPVQQNGWANDKANLPERLMRRFAVEARNGESVQPLAGPPQPGQFVLQINVDSYADHTFHGTLRVKDAQGNTVDEVRLPVRNGGGFGIAGQLNTFVIWSAADTLAYLRTRYNSSGS